MDKAAVEPAGREVYVKESQSSISGGTPYARKRAHCSSKQRFLENKR